MVSWRVSFQRHLSLKESVSLLYEKYRACQLQILRILDKNLLDSQNLHQSPVCTAVLI